MKMPPTRERPAPTRLVVPVVGADRRHVSPLDGRGPVTDYIRPLLLGYARRDLYLSDRHVTAVKRGFGAFAQLEGFAMGSVYLEEPDTAPAAFEALVASVNRYEITTVVLPEWRHLALVGDPEAVRRQFERVTGARFVLHEVTP
jgi:hypothetical protein